MLRANRIGWAGLACAFAIAGAAPASAAVTVFTDDLAFDAASPDALLQAFDTPIEGLVIQSGFDIITPAGILRDTVKRGGAQTTFSFDEAITSFGGVFDLSFAGIGHGLKFTLLFADGTEQVLARQFYQKAAGFFGFASTDPFVGVRINGGDSKWGNKETYTLGDFRFAVVEPSARLAVLAVPEPGAWALMLAGFGLSGLALRRRRPGSAHLSPA